MGTFSSWRSSTSTLLKCSNFKCVYFRHLTQTISLAGCRIFTANTNVANLYQRYDLPSTLGALRGDKLPCALVSCQISLIQRTFIKGDGLISTIWLPSPLLSLITGYSSYLCSGRNCISYGRPYHFGQNETVK